MVTCKNNGHNDKQLESKIFQTIDEAGVSICSYSLVRQRQHIRGKAVHEALYLITYILELALPQHNKLCL
jgi:hypothetical protein